MQQTIENPSRFFKMKKLPKISTEFRSRSTLQQNDSMSSNKFRIQTLEQELNRTQSQVPVVKIKNPYDPSSDYTQDHSNWQRSTEDTTFDLKPKVSKNLSKMFRVQKQARRELAMSSRSSKKSETKDELMVSSQSLETLHPKLKQLSNMNLGSDEG